MPIDIIVLCLLSAISVVAVYVKVIRDEHSGNPGNDGGLLEELDLPDIDLPPGIILPLKGPTVKIEDDVLV